MQINLAHVQDYCPPEPDHALAGRTPFCGLAFSQRLCDPDSGRDLPPLTGRTLRNQCQALRASGRRCRNCTTFDYRFCWVHVLKFFRLMIAPTTIPGVRGYGLFAVDPQRFLELGGLDADKRPVRDDAYVLFNRNEHIGGTTCCFVGEQLPADEHAARYPDTTCGTYVLQGVDAAHMLDGLVARTVLQFSNDAVNVRDPLYRRNYINRRTQRHVLVMPEYPVVMNADGVAYETTTALIARGPITHGQEIFWSYSGSPAACKTRDGHFKRSESYWQAANMQ
ncbi:MAG: hypothetical protein KGL42_13615 [Betaproteobacteria bacterium]|nr:hypothetical protein [Betaproteobacteria bacterium]